MIFTSSTVFSCFVLYVPFLWLRSRLSRRVDLVVLNIPREMFVITPLDRLVVIASCKQQDFDRKVQMRKARQPNALGHSCLLDHNRGARFERNQQPAAHLETFRKTRFQTDYLFVQRIDPNHANQFRNQTLLAITRLETWARPEIENDRLAACQQLASR